MRKPLSSFKDRRHYIKWVYQNLLHPFRAWRSAVTGLPRIHAIHDLTPKTRARVVASIGAGVAGSLALKARWLKQPVLWVAASTAEKLALEQLLCSPRVFVVPYPLRENVLEPAAAAIGSDAWQRSRAAFFKNNGLDPRIPTFYFSGRITPLKGLDQFVELAEKQRTPVQLVLAGLIERDSVPKEQFDKFLKTIMRSDFCKTFYLGKLEPRSNVRHMSYCDAVVALSIEGCEDFGVLPREALALGLPLLLTHWGGYKDIRLPARIERRMIRRFEIQLRRDKTLNVDFGRFNVADFVREVSRFEGRERRACSKAMLELNRRLIEKGLRQLKRVHVAAHNGASPPEFTALSRRILLNASASLRLDANVHFPRHIQQRIMGGKIPGA